MTDCHVSNKLLQQEDCKPIVYDMQTGLVKANAALDHNWEMLPKMIS